VQAHAADPPVNAVEGGRAGRGGAAGSARPPSGPRHGPRDGAPGARALEAYPVITEPGKEITWGELYVGSRQVFAEAGFTEVSRPSPRRVVMRVDFSGSLLLATACLWEAPVTAGREDGTAGARGHFRTSDADRERAVDVLKAAFAHGRLTKDEFSLRVGQVFASRTYADLAALTADMPPVNLYEVAYLCGGPGRVALTAVVTMCQDRRVKISPARHRIVVIRDEASHPVERALLDAAPWPGMGLGVVLHEVAGSAAVHTAGEELRRRGLLGKHSHLTAAGRELRDQLEDKVPEGLRIAVLGASGVDSDLRKVLDAPDPPPGSTLIPKRRDKGEHAYGETSADTSVAGYPGIPGRW
jgi:hypothetical protein